MAAMVSYFGSSQQQGLGQEIESKHLICQMKPESRSKGKAKVRQDRGKKKKSSKRCGNELITTEGKGVSIPLGIS